MKLLFGIILITILYGCIDDSSINTIYPSDNQEKSISDFLHNIPSNNLPIRIRCGFDSTLYNIEFNRNYKQFIPEGFEVVGKIENNRELLLILYASVGDILYPYLFTLDKLGNKIDSTYLHISTCAGDPNLELSTWTVIEKDLTINMIDTSRFYTYIEYKDDYKRSLDSMLLTKRTLRINHHGKFEKTTETIEKIFVN